MKHSIKITTVERSKNARRPKAANAHSVATSNAVLPALPLPPEFRSGMPDISSLLQIEPSPVIADFLRKWPLFGSYDLNGSWLNSGPDVCLKVAVGGRMTVWMAKDTASDRNDFTEYLKEFEDLISVLADYARVGTSRDIFYVGRWLRHPGHQETFRVCIVYAASADTLEVLSTKRVDWP